MANSRTVTWYDEMEEEFNPPRVEFGDGVEQAEEEMEGLGANATSADYLAGLLAISGISRSAASTPMERAPSYSRIDEENLLPPQYSRAVYDDAEVDVRSEVLDSLYGVVARRVDNHAVGATELTRLHRTSRDQTSRPLAADTARAWWNPTEYDGLPSTRRTEFKLWAGVPSGTNVRGGSWTDKHLKGGPESEVNTYLAALRDGRDSRGSANIFVLGHSDHVNVTWGRIRGEGRYTDEVEVEYKFFHGGTYCSVYTTWNANERKMLEDVSMSADVATVRARNGHLADRVATFFSALTIGILDDVLQVRKVLLLHNSSLRDMKKDVVRTQHGAELSGECGRVSHALCPAGAVYHGSGSQHVDFSYYLQGRGISHGRLRASDVPPAQIVLLGGNGGLSISGALVVARARATSTISLVCSSGVAGMRYRQFSQGRKHAPCVRDGVMSPIACAALHGDALGVLSATVDGSSLAVSTFVADCISTGELAIIDTLDPPSAKIAVADIADLCGYRAVFDNHDARGIGVELSGHGRTLRVLIRYLPSVATRWEEMLATEEAIRVPDELAGTTDSEIHLDWGASGIGRFLLVPYTYDGILRAKKISVARKGRFSHLTYDENGKRKLIAPADTILNYVVDTEFVTVKRGGEVLTYVYAMGIAKFCNGAYMGSWAAMDSEENVDSFLATLSGAERTAHEGAFRRLQMEGLPGTDMTGLLLSIRRRLVECPSARIYAKGRETEERLLHSSVQGGTRLFRTQNAAMGDTIRELGSLLPLYSQVAPVHGWSTLHNPAKEAVLFGYLAGLCRHLPVEQLAGVDGINTILPPPSGALV